MPALSQSGDDDASTHGGTSVDGGFERTAERLGEAFEPGDLGTDDAPGDGEIGAPRRLPHALLGYGIRLPHAGPEQWHVQGARCVGVPDRTGRTTRDGQRGLYLV